LFFFFCSIPASAPRQGLKGWKDGDRYTLGLLLELRKAAREAAEANDDLAARFHALLRSVSNPNVPDVAKDLPFKVRGFVGRSEEPLRTISLNRSIEVARAAFETAKRLYPKDRWVLLWGSWVVEDSMPLD
jgi:hypothetical protein